MPACARHDVHAILPRQLKAPRIRWSTQPPPPQNPPHRWPARPRCCSTRAANPTTIVTERLDTRAAGAAPAVVDTVVKVRSPARTWPGHGLGLGWAGLDGLGWAASQATPQSQPQPQRGWMQADSIAWHDMSRRRLRSTALRLPGARLGQLAAHDMRIT
jgi:hypothetical protein